MSLALAVVCVVRCHGVVLDPVPWLGLSMLLDLATEGQRPQEWRLVGEKLSGREQKEAVVKALKAWMIQSEARQ